MSIEDLNLDKQLLDKINKFAPIKHILKNKTDNDDQIIELLDDISKDYDGKLIVAKINIDENQKIAAQFAVRAIPTLIIFKDGNFEADKKGALSKSQLTAFIDSTI